MKLYQLHAKQALPISKKEAWEFLSNPKNLKIITPGHMGFDILSDGGNSMFPGQIIQYRVKPFPFFSTKWITEITHFRDGEYFVDEQRFGPYALWHHKHFLKEIPGGVEMEDVVDYKIPFGFMGRLAQTLFIKKQLETIFLFRERKMNEIFGKVDGNSSTLNFKSI